jgi:hypothetical protein
VVWALSSLGSLLAKNGDPDKAFPLLKRAAALVEPILAADRTNVNFGARAAATQEALGQAFAARASNPSRPIALRALDWQEARTRFRNAQTFWREQKDKGILVGRDLTRPDVLAREIAKCDAALGELEGGPSGLPRADCEPTNAICDAAQFHGGRRGHDRSAQPADERVEQQLVETGARARLGRVRYQERPARAEPPKRTRARRSEASTVRRL